MYFIRKVRGLVRAAIIRQAHDPELFDKLTILSLLKDLSKDMGPPLRGQIKPNNSGRVDGSFLWLASNNNFCVNQAAVKL